MSAVKVFSSSSAACRKREREDVSGSISGDNAKRQVVRTQGISKYLQDQGGWDLSLLAGSSRFLHGSEFVKPLGEGHFSRVILIKTPLFGDREVAFKVIPKDLAQSHPKITQVSSKRVGGEGLALFLRGGPNVVNTLGVLVQNERGEVSVLTDVRGVKDQTIYGVFSEYAPEMVTLETFEERLREIPPVIRRKIVKRVMKQVFNALAFMHHKNIAYRDLKPANILIHPRTGAIKVLDFGLTRFLRSQSERTSTMTGTCGFMAPEVYTGQPYNPFQADVFNFGVLLHLLSFDELIDWPENELDPLKYGAFVKAYMKGEDEGKGTAAPYLAEEAKKEENALAADLIIRLTRGDPDQRPSLKEIQQHPYFAD